MTRSPYEVIADNDKMQASCRRWFLTWQVSRGNRLILVVSRRKNVMASQRHMTVFAILLLALVPTISGCGTSALPPPVTVSYRASLLGVGQVVVISNTSGHHLYNVSVVGRNFEQVSSASVKATDHLSPGSSVEVGWLEFESWVPQPGETIEVYADNYATPRVSIIPNN